MIRLISINDPQLSDHSSEKISAVIVTHDSALTIRACLDSLYQASMPMSIVVVDNASTDGTVELVKGQYPDVELFQSVENLGFPGGCNAAMRIAQEQGVDFYFFLNPDARVEANCPNQLFQRLQDDEQLAFACPLIVDTFSGRIWYAGARFDLEATNFFHHGLGEYNTGQFDHISKTGRPTACAMMVRRSAVDEIGMMDESYFLYWEETEWACRFIRRGYGVGLCPTAMAYHIGAHSTGGAGSPLYEYYYSRNELRFVADITTKGKLSTTISFAPELSRRIASAAYRRGVPAGLGVARSVTLATFDFWRNRYGRRPGFP